MYIAMSFVDAAKFIAVSSQQFQFTMKIIVVVESRD